MTGDLESTNPCDSSWLSSDCSAVQPRINLKESPGRQLPAVRELGEGAYALVMSISRARTAIRASQMAAPVTASAAIATSARRTDRPGSARPPPPAATRAGMSSNHFYGRPVATSLKAVAAPDWYTLLYPPTVTATPRITDKELTQLGWDRPAHLASTHALPPFVELVIIDEATDPRPRP
jgi:hypothetical protein